MTDTPPEPEPVGPDTQPTPAVEPEPEPEPVRDPEKVLADNRRLGRELAAYKKENKAAFDRIAEMEKASMSEVDRRIAEERLSAADEERGKWEPLVRELRLSKAAVGKMAEPDLAGQLLAGQDFDINDPEAVAAAIDALIERHPSLGPGPTQRVPSFDQGARGNGHEVPKTMNDQLLDMLGIKKGP